MDKATPAFYDVADPKHTSRDLRDLIREALLHQDTCDRVQKIIEDGEQYGHKILRWDAGWNVVADYLDEKLDPFKKIDAYTKQGKLRSVYRERLEIDKRWRLTGNKAKRLAVKPS